MKYKKLKELKSFSFHNNLITRGLQIHIERENLADCLNKLVFMRRILLSDLMFYPAFADIDGIWSDVQEV